MLLQLPDSATRARAARDPAREPPSDRPGQPETGRSLAVAFVGAFEGWSLITIACDHEPMWLISHMSWALGIEDPQQLLARLAEHWRDDCPSNTFRQLDGDDRRKLLDKLDRAQVVMAREHQRKPITLLRAAALDGLIACFDNAGTRRLVAHLRERVIPEFYAFERASRALEQPILSVDAATIASNRLEFERRSFAATVLERLLDRLSHAGLVDADRLTAYRVVASELALGGLLEDYREPLAHGWSTPTQIAERWSGMTAMRVGKLIAHLGLKGSRAHSRAYLTKARGHDRTVISHVYSPAAVTLIERELQSHTHQETDHGPCT